jgi:hypothetical protein
MEPTYWNREKLQDRLDEMDSMKEFAAFVQTHPYLALRYARLFNQTRKRISQIPTSLRGDDNYFSEVIGNTTERVTGAANEITEEVIEPVLEDVIPNVWRDLDPKIKVAGVILIVGIGLYYLIPAIPLIRSAGSTAKEVASSAKEVVKK